MRELKFRAWDNTKKEWTLNIMECVSSSRGDIWLEPALKSHEVIIDQYTGLKTRRDGKEIYEGDILQYFGATLVVEYRDNAFWAVKYDSKEAWNICEFLGVGGATVIGNIHENPEILEAKHEE